MAALDGRIEELERVRVSLRQLARECGTAPPGHAPF